MAIHSVFLPMPPQQARDHLSSLGRLADGYHLEFIPADGGCVVAAVPEKTGHAVPKGLLRGALRRIRDERRPPVVLRTLIGDLGLPAA